jgi:ketosteroid isomerase-like protein
MMKDQENVKIVQQMLGAFGQGDMETFLSFLSEDIEWEVIGPEEIPFAGKYKGKEGVMNFVQKAGEYIQIQKMDPIKIVAQNDTVVIFCMETFMVNATGKMYEGKFVDVFTVKDGKVNKLTEYSDTGSIMKMFQ